MHNLPLPIYNRIVTYLLDIKSLNIKYIINEIINNYLKIYSSYNSDCVRIFYMNNILRGSKNSYYGLFHCFSKTLDINRDYDKLLLNIYDEDMINIKNSNILNEMCKTIKYTNQHVNCSIYYLIDGTYQVWNEKEDAIDCKIIYFNNFDDIFTYFRKLKPSDFHLPDDLHNLSDPKNDDSYFAENFQENLKLQDIIDEIEEYVIKNKDIIENNDEENYEVLIKPYIDYVCYWDSECKKKKSEIYSTFYIGKITHTFLEKV